MSLGYNGRMILSMNQEQRNRLHIARCLIEGKMLISEAAAVLGLSERQVIRLKKGVMKEGDAFVIHKNRGRKPKHAVADEQKQTIVKLKNSSDYQEANFAHFQELLEKREGIFLSYPSVYRILTSEGIKSPKKHTRRKAHRRRKRKEQEGMMVLIDASPYEWIIGGERVALHGAVDDATGKILALFFTKNECLEAYFEVLRQIITNNGVPLSIYADRHTIFLSPKYDKLTIEDELAGKKVNDTQFGRALKELGIKLISARTPQAKGRIERLWETLQSRLPVEFKLAKIDSHQDANAFLQKFIGIFNQKFAVLPENSEPAYRKLPESVNLDYILCVKENRTIDNGSGFSLDKEYYQIVKKDKIMPLVPKAKVTVLISSKIGIMAEYNGSIYETVKLPERPKKTVPVKAASHPKLRAYKPSPDHYWRQSNLKTSKTFFEESEREIIEALYSSRLAWR